MKTEIVIIGTLHGYHLENKLYRPEVLREILVALKPHAILNELPLSQVDKEGRPTYWDARVSPERWAANDAARTLKVKQIPFDRPDRQEFYQRTRYFERQSEAEKSLQKLCTEMLAKDPASVDLEICNLLGYAGSSQMEMISLAAADVINSEAYDAVIRVKHSLRTDILPSILAKYPGYEAAVGHLKFIRDEWAEGNRIMADNILKAAQQYPGKRLAVLTGGEHRYILRDLLMDEQAIQLKEYWELVEVGPENVPVVDHRPSIVWGQPLAEEEARRHSQLAREYWEAVIGGNWTRVSELRPTLGPEKWVPRYKDNPPVELVEVGKPYWQEGTSSGVVVPCIVKFADAERREIRLVTDFQYVDGEFKGRVVAAWGQPRVVEEE